MAFLIQPMTMRTPVAPITQPKAGLKAVLTPSVIGETDGKFVSSAACELTTVNSTASKRSARNLRFFICLTFCRLSVAQDFSGCPRQEGNSFWLCACLVREFFGATSHRPKQQRRRYTKLLAMPLLLHFSPHYLEDVPDADTGPKSDEHPRTGAVERRWEA